ncbi:MAG: hypothetical protein ABSB55_03700 [Acidimicrobiales bacterium]
MSDETGKVVLGTNRLGTRAHSGWVKRWSSLALAVVATTATMVGGGGPVQVSPKADVNLTADALRALALRGMRSSFSATYRLSAPGFVTATMMVAQRRSKLNATGWPSAAWMYRFTVTSPRAWLVGAEWDENPAGKVYECAQKSALQPWVCVGPIPLGDLGNIGTASVSGMYEPYAAEDLVGFLSPVLRRGYTWKISHRKLRVGVVTCVRVDYVAKKSRVPVGTWCLTPDGVLAGWYPVKPSLVVATGADATATSIKQVAPAADFVLPVPPEPFKVSRASWNLPTIGPVGSPQN